MYIFLLSNKIIIVLFRIFSSPVSLGQVTVPTLFNTLVDSINFTAISLIVYLYLY